MRSFAVRMSARSSSIDRMPSVRRHMVSGRLASSACEKDPRGEGKKGVRSSSVYFTHSVTKDKLLQPFPKKGKQDVDAQPLRAPPSEAGGDNSGRTNIEIDHTAQSARSTSRFERAAPPTLFPTGHLQDRVGVANHEGKHDEVMQGGVSPVQIKVPDLVRATAGGGEEVVYCKKRTRARCTRRKPARVLYTKYQEA